MRPLPAGCRLTCIWFEVVWVLTCFDVWILTVLAWVWKYWEDEPKRMLLFGTAGDFLSRSLCLVDVFLQCDDFTFLTRYPGQLPQWRSLRLAISLRGYAGHHELGAVMNSLPVMIMQ